MPQAFDPQAVLLVKVGVLGLALALLGAGLMISGRRLASEPIGAPLPQPIPFSHKHHVGDVGLDCRFCHVTVETRATPGMPSAQLCMTCHSQLFADQAVYDPLRKSLASGLPIGWTHVNRLPDYVYFDHSVHIAKQVACIECHGRLDQMPLVAKLQQLTMKWCIACHENPASHLHAAGDVFTMNPNRLSDADAHAVARLVQLESRQRLTECSTCHR